jgi:hypothetical protein
MKKILGVALVAVMVLAVAGAAMAQWGGPGQGYGRHGGMMGRGAGGPGAGFGPGGGPCGRQQGAAPATATAIDEAKAKEIASEYVSKNLPGYQVEKFVVRTPRVRCTRSRWKAEGELQYLHRPWGMRSFGAGCTF